MTVQNQRDDIGEVGVQPDGQSPGADVGVRNTVVAASVSGIVVQAQMLTTGDTHHHHRLAPGRPVPRQLPAVPSTFVGRVHERAEFTAALEHSVIVALAGPGGIGKTWLALHWAHQHAERFPDGHLFVNLHGFSPTGEPMTSAEAVRGFLDALGVDPHRIPADSHAQAALYRSLVAGKRMLIVLDNAATVEQIIPLLPGDAGCVVAVTSRRRLDSLVTAHGAHPLHLGVLTAIEARDLLTTRLGVDRVGSEPGAVDDLLAVCGGFPLALAIVAGRARTHPRLPLATLASELRDEATRLDVLDSDDSAASLPTVLSWSLRALTAEQREAFALLGIAAGSDIGRDATASLLGVSSARVRTILRSLEQVSLLDQDTPGRWRMHDLIRRYAVERATQDHTGAEREAAIHRVVDFYLHTAEAGARLLQTPVYEPMVPFEQPSDGCVPRPPGDARAALAWFEAEYRNLGAVEQAAAESAWDTRVWQMAWAMQVFRILRGHIGDNVTAWRAALTAAYRLPGPTIVAWTRGILGVAL
ncbi:MAG: NB-ARC domain-containing protein, partial [Actinomycetota bacterium]|nr:NB-ARC domain-containing protein [Actinomycetota bacterium]